MPKKKKGKGKAVRNAQEQQQSQGRPEAHEVRGRDEAPETGQIPRTSERTQPHETQAPKTGPIPRASERPHPHEAPKTGQIPRTSERPQPHEAPKTGQIPRASERPHPHEAPKTGQIPRASERPQPHEAPTTGQIPRASERPTEAPPAGKNVHVTPEALALHLEQALLLKTPFARRPAYNNFRDKIGLIVNYFPVELPNCNVYHYDVEITLVRRDSSETASAVASPHKKFRCLNTKKNRQVINKLVHNCEYFEGLFPAYDGQKNLYLKSPLKVSELTVLVEVSEGFGTQGTPEDPAPRTDIFEVAIKAVEKRGTGDNAIDLGNIHALFKGTVSEVPKESVMAVETILRNGPCFNLVPIYRSFFYRPKRPEDVHPLSGGKEIWFGYHQGLILAEWKPMLNINVTATTFWKSGPVIDYICEMLRITRDDLRQLPQLREMDRMKLKKLKNLKITTRHLGYDREYRIIKLTPESADSLSFNTDHNQATTTVRDYFQERYQISLDYSNLPCLHVHPQQKGIYLPPELCSILPEQHSKERLTESQTTEMIRVSSLPPEIRFRKIQEVVRRANFNNDPCNREFGVRVSSDPLRVEGQVIIPPNILYFNDKRVRPVNGSWEMKEEKFMKGATVNSWVVLSFVNERFCDNRHLENFAHSLRSTARDYGMNLESLEFIKIFGGRNVNVSNILQNFHKGLKGVKLAVIVLEGKASPIYAEIKQVSETVLGLVTQCVQAINVKNVKSAVLGNICQKINAKMGGVNNGLTPGEKPKIFQRPVMVIGADVTHPPPGTNNRPSIAAAVGSLDIHPSRYAVAFRCQWPKEGKKAIEEIKDLKGMIRELLQAFEKNALGKKPERIIFYRDGVSEGEFVTVRNHELPAIRKACLSLNPDYKPFVTFIIVQKRHHTRFRPQDARNGVGRHRNVPPGTVVDRAATSRVNFDFFLCSQFGLQGTSRPCHYTVISDDNNFTADEIQKLTYYLCHIYARCTRSISVPVPVAYADLAAYRAARYIETALSGSDEGSSASDDVSEAERKRILSNCSRIIKIKPELSNTMYFV